MSPSYVSVVVSGSVLFEAFEVDVNNVVVVVVDVLNDSVDPDESKVVNSVWLDVDVSSFSGNGFDTENSS